MVDNNTFLFLSITEQFSSAPMAIKAVFVVIPIAIIALIVFAIIKKKKKTATLPAEETATVAAPKAKANAAATTTPPENKTEAKINSPVANAAENNAEAPFVANILIIEDDSIMLLAIRSILAKSGYNLITAKDGKEAFEKLDTEEYDVVVTDLMMPYANGLEVVAKIRNDVSKRHVAVIVCSSVGNEETITEAFRLGADDYLKKPIKAEELLQRVKKLLDRRTNNPQLVTKKTTRANV